MKRIFLIPTAFLLILFTGCPDLYRGSDINWITEKIETLSVTLSANSIQKNQSFTVTLTGTVDSKYKNCKIFYELYKDIDSEFKQIQMIYKTDGDQDWNRGWSSEQSVAAEEFNSINKTVTLLIPAEGLYKLHFYFTADNSEEENCVGEFSDTRAIIVES